eukprot:3344929-Amphidinium_carterae.1
MVGEKTCQTGSSAETWSSTSSSSSSICPPYVGTAQKETRTNGTQVLGEKQTPSSGEDSLHG